MDINVSFSRSKYALQFIYMHVFDVRRTLRGFKHYLNNLNLLKPGRMLLHLRIRLMKMKALNNTMWMMHHSRILPLLQSPSRHFFLNCKRSLIQMQQLLKIILLIRFYRCLHPIRRLPGKGPMTLDT